MEWSLTLMNKLLFLLLIPSLAFSAEYTLENVMIEKVKIEFYDDRNNGGCLAYVSEFDNSIMNNDALYPFGKCKSHWITMHCDRSDKRNTLESRGRMFLDATQIAKALNKPVTIEIDSALSINNYCAMKSITWE